ncbi:succinate dehydrogenase cytochrome b560 subunit, mitochondrial-like [Ptychodera flava]|uniref:succinate dehydrogenase cytochrome b560 subunit, mitochondrial-like n=1 Tax=Ptychodera flava TaxID=63121 RepID=UPI003969C939
MALLVRTARCQHLLFKQSSPVFLCRVASGQVTTPSKVPLYHLENHKQKEEFWDFQNDVYWKKQKTLKRPRSPFWIYQPQLTAILSINHRATGAIMALSVATFAVGINVAPHDFMYYLDLIKGLELPAVIPYLGKAVVAWPLMYHMGNGVRHLFWDMGYGFQMKNLYRSGYAVCLWSIVAACALAAIPVS